MDNPSVNQQTELNNTYLLAPIIAVISTVGVLGVLFIFPLFLSASADVWAFSIMAMVSILQFAVLGSIMVYYKEAQELKAANNNWVPLWWAYTIATFLLGGVAAFVYLLQRRRHTDVDLTDIL